jgi:hypothetical protein
MANVVQNVPVNLQGQMRGFRLAAAADLSDAITTQTGASTQDAVTASTTQTQAGGTKIVAAWTNISVANSSDAITFPQAVPGKSITIVNSSGQTIQAFPFLGDTINAAALNAAVTIATATSSDYYSVKAGQWWGGATTNEA